MPTSLHQIVVAFLTELFVGIARRSGVQHCAAPMDVVLSDNTILQPDVLYVSKRGENHQEQDRRAARFGRLKSSPAPPAATASKNSISTPGTASPNTGSSILRPS